MQTTVFWHGPSPPLVRVRLPDGPVRADVKLPAIASVSLCHTVNPKWDVLADVGWTDWSVLKSLDVLTTCLFNFMNRLLEGHGVKGNSALYHSRGQALRDEGYALLLRALPPLAR